MGTRGNKLKIICVCGARPNFMKVAPILRALRRIPNVESMLVHTGQHYDQRMSRFFFDELEIPQPDANLEVGSGSHTEQTAEVMKRFEPICAQFQPDCVLVVGDVNSTLATALTAVKMGIAVAHVEAGLRSFDRTMPEEINRILVDAISELHFVTEQSAVENLRREGVAEERIHFVGNVMIDTLLAHRERAAQSVTLETCRVQPKQYAAVTLHRPSNVDDADTLSEILAALKVIRKDMPVIFPVHPRSQARMREQGLWEVALDAGITLMEPLGYLDFLKLMSEAALVLTDSGGIQEETTILSVPCLTLRENTERPATVTHGTNQLVGPRTDAILAAYEDVRRNPLASGRRPPLWDGQASERIVDVLRGWAADRIKGVEDAMRREPRRMALGNIS